MVRILLLVLCVAVVLQMLGLSFTLWDAMVGFDAEESVAPEGFTILAGLPIPFRISPSHALMEPDEDSAPFDFARSIFHPPPAFR